MGSIAPENQAATARLAALAETDPLLAHLEARVTEGGDGYVELSAPASAARGPSGEVTPGAAAALLEAGARLAAASLKPSGAASALEFSVTRTAPARGAEVVVRAEVVRADLARSGGDRLAAQVCAADLYDQDASGGETLAAVARATFLDGSP